MAYTLQGIKDYVRLHLDLDSTELADGLLDAWCREATTKITHGKQRQPWLETSWSLTPVSGTSDYAYSTITTAELYVPQTITSVMRSNLKLQWIGRDEAERRYLPGTANTSQACYFSTWGQTLRLYPTPTTVETYYLRGYRKPVDWVALGAGGAPDMPDEYHDSVRLYVLACAYLQQEDPDMASNYFSSFDDEQTRLAKNYGEAPPSAPFIMGGGPRINRPQGRLAYPWD